MLRGMYGEPGQRRHARRLHLLALRRLLRAPRRALVDPRPVLDPGRRGAPGQPRLRRRDAALAARRSPSRSWPVTSTALVVAVAIVGGRRLGDRRRLRDVPGRRDRARRRARASRSASALKALDRRVDRLRAGARSSGAAPPPASPARVMLGGYVVNSYRTVVPAFDAAGQPDLVLAGPRTTCRSPAGPTGPASASSRSSAVVLIAVGVEAFARRDVGVTVALRTPGLPRALLGVRGPLGRSFGDLLPTALAWGIGLGLYGVLMAAASRGLHRRAAERRRPPRGVPQHHPGDRHDDGGGVPPAGLRRHRASCSSGWRRRRSSRGGRPTRSAGRLELLLTTPLTRVRWAVASGIGAWLAIALVTVLLAAVALGVGCRRGRRGSAARRRSGRSSSPLYGAATGRASASPSAA